MSAGAAHDREPRRALGRRRLQVLTLLEEAGVPLTVSEVAARLGVHENTARFHLEGLLHDDLARRSVDEPTGPGRPRVRFDARTKGPATDRRSYRLLAQMLAGLVTEQLPSPSTACEEAGRAWGRYLADAPPPFTRPAEADSLEALVADLDEVGFDSHPVPEPDGVRLEISHCPFLEVASRSQEVVCAMHLGLIRGVLEEAAAPLEAESLTPLVEPSRCVARLRRTGPAR